MPHTKRCVFATLSVGLLLAAHDVSCDQCRPLPDPLSPEQDVVTLLGLRPGSLNILEVIDLLYSPGCQPWRKCQASSSAFAECGVPPCCQRDIMVASHGVCRALVSFTVLAGPATSRPSKFRYRVPEDHCLSSPEQAQQILNRLKQGENFAEVARKESIDSTSGDGGSLGTVALSSLRPSAA